MKRLGKEDGKEPYIKQLEALTYETKCGHGIDLQRALLAVRARVVKVAISAALSLANSSNLPRRSPTLRVPPPRLTTKAANVTERTFVTENQAGARTLVLMESRKGVMRSD